MDPAILQLYGDKQLVNRGNVAVVAWLIWDIIIMMDREVKYIWQQKKSLHSWLYFIARYQTPCALTATLAIGTSVRIKDDNLGCKTWLWYHAIAALLIPESTGEAIMLMRIYALYGRSKKILALVFTLFILRTTLVVVSSAVEISTATYYNPFPNSPISGCFSPSKIHLATWLRAVAGVNIAVAALYFFLTLYKFVTNTCTSKATSFQELFQVQNTAPLLSLFMRDGSFYFLLVLAGEIIFVTYSSDYDTREVSLMGFPFVAGAYTVAATRLVLNLRASVSDHDVIDSPDDIILETRQSSIEFARRSTVSSVQHDGRHILRLETTDMPG